MTSTLVGGDCFTLVSLSPASLVVGVTNNFPWSWLHSQHVKC